jgi:hypothetical protein
MALESFLTNDLSPPLVQEVEEFLDSQDTGHPFQFPQWSGRGSKLVLLRESGRIRWAGAFGVQSPLGRAIPWIRGLAANRGPVCDDRHLWEACADELAVMLTRDGSTYFDVAPDWVLAADEQIDFLKSPKWCGADDQRASLRIDLLRSEDEIFGNFRETTRYKLRRAVRLGATASVASSDAEIHEFLRLYRSTADLKGFAADPPDEVRRLIRWLLEAESRGALLLARKGDTIHGGSVIVRCGKRCWYVWGANDRQENVNAGHILQWKGMQWAKSHGCSEYDFGGYTPGATSGPAWFKAGFGGRVVHFVASHRRVLRPGRNRLFSLLSRIR